MSQPNKFKIVLVILLGAVLVWLFGHEQIDPQSSGGGTIVIEFPSQDTNEALLKRLYATYNDMYFDNKLPKDTQFSNDLGGTNNMADTGCDNLGQNCTMRFNPHYTAAWRTAEGTMLHEMCHVKTWTRLLDENRPPMMDPQEYAHSDPWQACMLGLDAMGALRRINIDYYKGN